MYPIRKKLQKKVEMTGSLKLIAVATVFSPIIKVQTPRKGG
jgi:hypothetical protein